MDRIMKDINYFPFHAVSDAAALAEVERSSHHLEARRERSQDPLKPQPASRRQRGLSHTRAQITHHISTMIPGYIILPSSRRVKEQLLTSLHSPEFGGRRVKTPISPELCCSVKGKKRQRVNRV